MSNSLPTGDAVDIVVAGAGPAGLAAACAAAESGRRVAVIDDNPDAGGQIWRGERALPLTRESRTWFQRIARSDLDWHVGTTIVGTVPPDGLHIIQGHRASILRYQRLILATGAREIFLPFPGWTLPGSLGAGGLQALVKSGLPIEGKRVVVAGSGPLLPAVAAYLQGCGADIALVAEQAPWRKVSGFVLFLLIRHFTKFRQSVTLRRSLRSVPYRFGIWPRRVEGTDHVEGVVLTDGVRHFTEPCDYLACGFGLMPNLELARLLGCDIDGGKLRVNHLQETTVAGVYGAGEVCGIGGLETALIEGQIAGYAAAGDTPRAQRLVSRGRKQRRFAERLAQVFALRNELRRLAEPDTVVCRCEDVTYGQLRNFTCWREARLHGRCGMGPCQGRVCGSAIDVLFGWQDVSIRPPIYPATAEQLQIPPPE